MDISESPQSKISACLCESDYCNSYTGPDESSGNRQQQPQQTAPRRSENNNNSRRPPPTETPRTQAQAQTQDPFQTGFNRDDNKQQPFPNRLPAPDKSERRQETRPAPSQVVEGFDNGIPGLQCYSCGSLLNPNKKCDRFDKGDKSQVQTCLKDEACLMYSWKKSPTEVATLRECFPTRVLLGSITDPLTTSRTCSQRDITDEGSGSIYACLCNTDFCNDDENSPFSGIASQAQAAARLTTTTERPRPPPPTTSRRRLTTTQPPTTTRRPPPTPRQSSLRAGCPTNFQSLGDGCYFVSNDQVGWIEARKMCELLGARLIRRRRTEFWISGNDIEEEGVWEWARTRSRVPRFGWTDEPFQSPEENCLAWTLYDSGRNDNDGWHPSSCCNNLKYICEL